MPGSQLLAEMQMQGRDYLFGLPLPEAEYQSALNHNLWGNVPNT